jgi:purine nucleoside permease
MLVCFLLISTNLNVLICFLLIITVETKWSSTVALLNYAFSIAVEQLNHSHPSLACNWNPLKLMVVCEHAGGDAAGSVMHTQSAYNVHIAETNV